MTIDDDGEVVVKHGNGNFTLCQFLSWVIWRAGNQRDVYPSPGGLHFRDNPILWAEAWMKEYPHRIVDDEGSTWPLDP